MVVGCMLAAVIVRRCGVKSFKSGFSAKTEPNAVKVLVARGAVGEAFSPKRHSGGLTPIPVPSMSAR